MKIIPSIPRKYTTDRLATVLIAPVISEKGTYIGDRHNQMIFRVRPDSTKPEIKAAVEAMFNVQVDRVQVLNTPEKVKRTGKITGRRRGYKKAYVCLKPGQEIRLAAES